MDPEGTQVSLGGSQKSVMRERGRGQDGALGGGGGFTSLAGLS